MTCAFPESMSTASPRRLGFSRALALFKKASVNVPAYKDFLRKHGVRPEQISEPRDFSRVPLTDKENYITRYSPADLCWRGKISRSQHISSSSGSTGIPFYWPRSEKHDVVTGRIFRRIYEGIFDTRRGSTLFLDMFALGSWLAGLQFYDGAERVASEGSKIAIIASGIEKNVAIDAIRRLSKYFDRVILAGYPPFLKNVLEDGKEAGVSWGKMNVRLLAAGEAISEVWRDRVLRLAGRRTAHDLINVYGMAEAGVVAHETPLTISLRKIAHANPVLAELLTRGGNLCPLYQYDPSIRYFEMEANDALVLTTDAGIPLLRYNTRDQGGIFPFAAAANGFGNASLAAAHKATAWKLPFVYLYGRRDLSISFYALNIYVENLKRALESAACSASFSGLFTMHVVHTRNLDQRFEITIELARGVPGNSIPLKPLAAHVVRVLEAVNAEYAKLHATLGKNAVPRIKLVKYGEIGTRPGRKHAWVRKSQ